MAVNLKTIPGDLVRSLTDFGSYRELIRRPIRDTLIYLAILITVPALLFAGIQIYTLNRLLAEITSAMEGNLPDIRIEKGIVQMEGDIFLFQKENEYTRKNWLNIVEGYAAGDTALRERAEEWIKSNFPDEEKLIIPSDVLPLLEGMENDEKLRALLEETSNFGSLVFQVDLTGDEPEFAPGAWGFALTRDSYYINILGKPIKTEISRETSAIINDAMLQRWRKALLWQRAPLMVAMIYVLIVAVSLVVVLGGCALAGLTAVLLKSSLPFKMVFSLSVYALTPAVLLILVFTVLSLMGISLGGFLISFVVIYGVYLVGAAKKCSSVG